MLLPPYKRQKDTEGDFKDIKEPEWTTTSLYPAVLPVQEGQGGMDLENLGWGGVWVEEG